MLSAHMIVKAWMDDAYRAALTDQGIEVPPRPEDLGEDQLDLFVQDGEVGKNAPQTCFC